MKIAICDDDRALAMQMCERIKLLVPESKIFVFESGKSLIEKSIDWDIAFLDIEMDEMNGFQVAEYLKEKLPNCIFSFVTAHPELAVEGYDYQPFRYILKDAPEPVLNRKIKENVWEFYARNRVIEVSFKEISCILQPRDIQWIEADSHCVHLHTNEGIVAWGKTMNEAERELQFDHIIRCHRSFAINLNYLSHFSGEKIILKNGQAISVGRMYRKKLKEAYREFKAGKGDI